jgi:hypothetical protein
MPIKINYLSLINVDNNEIGQIDFFDSYMTPSKDFPYFYIGQKNTILYSANWPTLVPFLYSQKIKIVNSSKTETNSFLVHSFTNAAGVATLNFTNANSVSILKGLLEDREAYFLENGTYNDWNKTFTPKTNITNGSTTFFTANANYYISSITVNTVNSTGTIVANAINATNVTTAYVLTNIEIEFGLFRIPNQSDSQSVYFSGIKGKFVRNNDTNLSLNGLKIKSQIIGHTHEHIHNMNNHTHTMPHTHDLSSHSHYMDHQHDYNDIRSDYATLNLAAFTRESIVNPPYDTYNVTGYTRDYTDSPNINSTGDASQSVTSTPSNNITSNVLSRTTNKDDTNSNNNNFKVNDKIIPESYTIYPYIYGQTYFE